MNFDIRCRNRLANTSNAMRTAVFLSSCGLMSAISTGSMPNLAYSKIPCQQKRHEDRSAVCMSYALWNHVKILVQQMQEHGCDSTACV